MYRDQFEEFVCEYWCLKRYKGKKPKFVLITIYVRTCLG